MNIKFNNRRGLPGGPNEVTSKGSISIEGYREGSPDFNNDFNIIESSNISMEGVPFPVMGTDNFGNSEIMMPGANYEFPGDLVIEIPLAQVGGAMDTAYVCTITRYGCARCFTNSIIKSTIISNRTCASS